MQLRRDAAFFAAGLLVASAGAIPKAQEATASSPTALSHVHHVTTSWKDTPGTQGLFPTAVAEAGVALQHARLAAAANDLDGMKRHAGHVLHALDPSLEASGPGAGYGLRKAAAGTRQHIQLAAKMPGASKSLATHSEHVATAMSNVLEWVEASAELARGVRAATAAQEAASLARELVARIVAITDGVDADGDGKIGWQKGEGGLAQARAHLELLTKSEQR